MKNEEATKSKSLFGKAFFNSSVKSVNVKFPELVFGYLLGPFGALLSGGIFTSVLQGYFTDVLHLSLTFLTILQLVSVVFVVAGNLIMGQILERTKTMQGKARPWILMSALTLSVASVLMFIIPSQNAIFKMVWMAIAYNLFYSVAYPIYNTANSTLIPVSTRNSKQRGLLASVTNMAGLGVMGVGSMIFPALVSLALKENQWLWFVVMLGVAIFCFLTCFLQYKFTRERVTEESVNLNLNQSRIPLGKQLKAVTSDKYWWLIVVFYLIFQFSGAIKNGSMLYFCKWVLDNSFWPGVAPGDSWGMSQSLLGILGAIPMAVAVVIVWPLSNKFGKKNVTLVGMVVGVAGGIIALIGGKSVVPVAVGIALKCLGSAPACYMILAMISDVLDHLEAKNGFRCDGLTMSIYSSIMVAATPLGNAIISGLLGAGGYDGNLTVGTMAQTASAQKMISVSYIWIETIAYAVCAAILIFFIVEKYLKSDQKRIRERQKAEVLAAGGEWVEPEERMRLEQEEQDRLAEEARINESKAYCQKKGLNFEEIEAQYQAKLAAKKAAAEAKAAAKAAKNGPPPDSGGTTQAPSENEKTDESPQESRAAAKDEKTDVSEKTAENSDGGKK